MSQDYSPSLVTKNLVFCGDAAMKSAAGPATLLYDKVNDNNGTMYNGTCLDLDGSDDYVLVPDGGTYGYSPGNGSWTISMWVNADVFSDNTLLSNTSGSPVTSAFYISTAGKIAFTNYDGAPGWQVHAGDTTLSTGTWYLCTWVNYAGSLSTNATMKMFVNGVADSSEFGSVYTTNGGPVDAIGRITSSYFNGKIADVRFYDVAFSDANVKEIYDDSKVIIPTKNDASGGFVAQTNLKRWWSFAEGAGVLTYDGSGNQADGTMTNMASDDWLTGQTGAPQLVEGYNRPMTFDGSDDVVANISLSLPTGTASRTIAAWVWLDDATSSDGVFGYGTGPSTPYQVFEFYNYGSSGIRLHYATYNSGGATALSSKTWYHLAGTYDGTTAKVYINGALNHTDTVTLATVSSFARFGCVSYSSSPSDFVKGNINEVVFYDAALSLAQVQALAATDPNGGPLPPDPMSLSNSSDVVGYWRNDGAVTWADRSGSGYTGTVAGSPDTLLFKQGINGSKNVNTGRDGQGFPLSHQNNGAMGFNGSDTEVVIPHASVFDITAALTQEMWFKIDTFANSGGGSYPTLIAKNAGNYRWFLQNTSFDLHSRFSGLSDLVTNTTFSTGQWYYVVLTKDSGGFTWYVNGVFDKEDSQTGAMSTNGDDYVIGNWSAGGARAFQGQIANARIYNRALTYAEIQQNYNSFKSRFGE